MNRINDVKSIKKGKLRFNDQSHGEEIANSISHGVPALFYFIGTFVLAILAIINQKGLLAIFAVSIFGLCFTLLFLTSFLFHTVKNLKIKKVLQILDHCVIYLMILGSYTPICLCSIGGFWGWICFAINFACCTLGIVVNLIDMHKFYKLSQALYIIAGWMVVIIAIPAIRVIPVKGLILLVIGGVLYTLSVIFYNLKDTKFMHFVFHLFVVAGSVFHFLFVLNYIAR